MLASIQSAGKSSVSHRRLKIDNKTDCREAPPCTKISGGIPSGPWLFLSLVLLIVISTSAIVIGSSSSSRARCICISSRISQSVFIEELIEVLNPSCFDVFCWSEKDAICWSHWMETSRFGSKGTVENCIEFSVWPHSYLHIVSYPWEVFESRHLDHQTNQRSLSFSSKTCFAASCSTKHPKIDHIWGVLCSGKVLASLSFQRLLRSLVLMVILFSISFWSWGNIWW